jgi:hypothetical protein
MKDINSSITKNNIKIFLVWIYISYDI